MPRIRERSPGRHSSQPGRSVRRSRWAERLETQKRAKTRGGGAGITGRTGRHPEHWLKMVDTPRRTGWKAEGPLMGPDGAPVTGLPFFRRSSAGRGGSA